MHWDINHCWVPMFHLQFPTDESQWRLCNIHLCNQENKSQTQQAQVVRTWRAKGLTHSRSLSLCFFLFFYERDIEWICIKITSRSRKAAWYNRTGETSDRCFPGSMLSHISNPKTHVPQRAPQTKQVCWGPALSNWSETAWWLAHTCVGKFKNGKAHQALEIYGGGWVIAVKTDSLPSSWPAGAVTGGAGKLGRIGEHWAITSLLYITILRL